MKKLLFTLILVTSSAIAQQTPTVDLSNAVSTTQEEYNYIANNGLKRNMEEGADMKQNYRLVKFFNQGFEKQYEIDYYLFQKTADGSEGLKAIAVVIKSEITNKTFYICIPMNNKGLSAEYFKSVMNFSEQLQKAYSYATSQALAKLASFHYNK